MTPKIPAEVVERCAAQAYEDWFTAAKWSECPEANGYKDHWRKETIAVLRACGYASLRAENERLKAALSQARLAAAKAMRERCEDVAREHAELAGDGNGRARIIADAIAALPLEDK